MIHSTESAPVPTSNPCPRTRRRRFLATSVALLGVPPGLPASRDGSSGGARRRAADAVRTYRDAALAMVAAWKAVDRAGRSNRPNAGRLEALHGEASAAQRLWSEAMRAAIQAIQDLHGGPKPSRLGPHVERTAPQAVRVGDLIAVVATVEDEPDVRLHLIDIKDLVTVA